MAFQVSKTRHKATPSGRLVSAPIERLYFARGLFLLRMRRKLISHVLLMSFVVKFCFQATGAPLSENIGLVYRSIV